jgi:hypothetical protein
MLKGNGLPLSSSSSLVKSVGHSVFSICNPSSMLISATNIGKEVQEITLALINELCDFYSTTVLNDDKSDGEATQVILMSDNVDEFMEALGDEWGLDWEVIANIPDGETYQQARKRRHYLLGYATEGGPSVRLRTE